MITRDEKKKGMISFSSDDFTSDTKNNVVTVTDPSGNTLTVDMWKYAIYFFINIQYKQISEQSTYVDGIRIDKYIEYYIKEKKLLNLESFLMDSTCYGLQQEMQEKYNTHINWVALYGLCMYIREIINRRLAVLFKPSIKEILDEVKSEDNLKEIILSTKDGRKCQADSIELKKVIINALNESHDESVELYKIVKKVDVYTKEYGQIEFVRYISVFFHEYFDGVKRRKNGYLTRTEQNIICYLLKFFEFTPEIVQESRFRQLFNSKYKPLDFLFPISIPGIINSNKQIYLEFIPYRIWSKGLINPLKAKSLHQEEGSTRKLSINMGENPDITEIINVIDGLYGNIADTVNFRPS